VDFELDPRLVLIGLTLKFFRQFLVFAAKVANCQLFELTLYIILSKATNS